VRPYLASFFAPELTEEVRRVKADYWDVWSDLLQENFFQILSEWCSDNDMEYLVHLNHEHKMTGLVRSEGDFFKAMRHVQIPGVDTIWNQIWPGNVADFPKLASSAAHLFGRPRAFSESFAAYRIRPTVEQARWVINYQFVRGINLLEVMFYPSSASVPKRSGWLASKEFPEIAEYVNRASYLLSQGRPAAQIALYFPTTSLWFGDEEAKISVWNIACQLLERQRDFDFMDEQSLSSILKPGNGILTNLSGQSHRAVIIPSVSVISKTALDRLREFAASGGCVIFLGREPYLLVERTFLKATALPDLDWAVREPSGELTSRVMEALPQPDVLFGRPCPSVKYLRRSWRDADLYFFFNESDEEQHFQTTLSGNVQAQVWDATSGRIKLLNGVSSGNGIVRLPLTLAPYEAEIIVIGPVP